jgi:hypothetical protein
MPTPTTRITEPEITRDDRGRINSVHFAFGPHHFVQVLVKDGRVQCTIGAADHGIRADASEADSELDEMIDELRDAFPEAAF